MQQVSTIMRERGGENSMTIEPLWERIIYLFILYRRGLVFLSLSLFVYKTGIGSLGFVARFTDAFPVVSLSVITAFGLVCSPLFCFVLFFHHQEELMTALFLFSPSALVTVGWLVGWLGG